VASRFALRKLRPHFNSAGFPPRTGARVRASHNEVPELALVHTALRNLDGELHYSGDRPVGHAQSQPECGHGRRRGCNIRRSVRDFGSSAVGAGGCVDHCLCLCSRHEGDRGGNHLPLGSSPVRPANRLLGVSQQLRRSQIGCGPLRVEAWFPPKLVDVLLNPSRLECSARAAETLARKGPVAVDPVVRH